MTVKNEHETRLIAETDIHFDDPADLKKILLTHGVDKSSFEFFKTISSATEIEIERKSNKIVKATELSDSYNYKSQKISAKLPINDWPNREVFFLVKDYKGKHKIGGSPPSDFTLPSHNVLKTPFQYIGFIDTSDDRFNWINLPRLDIAFPLYECNYGIFLDYNDPKNPKILNPDTFNDAWFNEKTKGLDTIVFQNENFSTSDNIHPNNFEESGDDILLCGVPLWYQAPSIPICPKTGEVMSYVCTINSDSSLEVQDDTKVENVPFGDYLIFADQGHLFVFYHPDSKILHLEIQF